MTLPYQEHNSLLATREFLITLLDETKFPELDQRIRDNSRYLLKFYPTKEKLNELYKGNTIEDISNPFSGEGENNPNKILNDNQTWDTPGFKWKTEVEYISVEEE
jgi:hypothetical protein